MSADQPVAREDIARAALGDLAALRRLRGHWQGLASGRIVNSLAPPDDALAQLELLAEMATSAGGEPEDWVSLLVAYTIRTSGLRRDVASWADRVKKAVQAGDTETADRWSGFEAESSERLGHYSAKINALVDLIINDPDPEAAATLLTVLSLQADEGNEQAAIVIQKIVGSVTPARAAEIQAAVRKLEECD